MSPDADRPHPADDPSRASRARTLPRTIAVLTVACLAATTIALALLQLDPTHPAANTMHLLAYWQPTAAAWLILSLLVLLLRRLRRVHIVPGSPHPGIYTGTHTGMYTGMWTILLVAALARILTVFATVPTLSDDIWRYIHDGATLAAGRHPYALAPAQVRPESAPAPDVLPRINHPRVVTIYQPASQIVFAALWKLHTCTGTQLRADQVFRLGFVAFDLAIVALLLVAARQYHVSPWWVALYAWHPLPITEVAASGHQDAIGIAFVVAALLCLEASRRRIASFTSIPSVESAAPVPSPRSAICCASTAGLCLALAIAVKPLAVPLALPCLWHLKPSGLTRDNTARDITTRNLTLSAKCVLTFLLTITAGLAALYMPFALTGPGLGPMLETVRLFAGKWAFNGPIHEALARTLGPRLLINALLGLVLLACVLPTLRRDRPWATSLVYFFAALLLSSTAYPWYLLWALALLPIVWARQAHNERVIAALWIWSLTILFSYAVWIDPDPWCPPILACVIEFLPVYAMLLLAAVHACQRYRAAESKAPPTAPH